MKKFLSIITLTLIIGSSSGQVNLLDSSKIEHNIPADWHATQNFPEFFIFEKGGILFLSIEHPNDEWQIIRLFENGDHLDKATINGATIENERIGYEIDLVYLTLNWSYRGRGVGGNFTSFVAVNLTDGIKMLEFEEQYEAGHSDSGRDERVEWSETATCKYKVAYELVNDTLNIKEVSILNTEIVREEITLSTGNETRKSAKDLDCHPDITAGIYICNGKEYQRVESKK